MSEEFIETYLMALTLTQVFERAYKVSLLHIFKFVFALFP